MLTLHNTQETPPGGYRYFQTETGMWIRAASLNELHVAVKKHRTANKLPVGTDFKAEIENQLCENCPPETCGHNNTGAFHQAGPISFDTIIKTASMLTEWFWKYKKERVSLDTATKRAAICVQCPRNQPIEGCNGCNLRIIRETIVGIVGGQETKHNAKLFACSMCGCSLQAKIQLPLELLRKYLTPEKITQFPDYCWVKKADND